MFKHLVMIVLLVCSFSAAADSDIRLDPDGLTTEQKAQLASQIEQMKKETNSLPITTDNVNEWTRAGQQFGQMLGGAAKEVGMAVNDFVKTPVGKMTAALIIWHYMGNSIIHFVMALIVLFVGIAAIRHIIGRICNDHTEYDMNTKTWWGGYAIKSHTREELSTDATLGMTMCYGAVIALSVIVAITA